MNRLKQIGLQQWRLKPAFRVSSAATAQADATTAAPIAESELSHHQVSEDQMPEEQVPQAEISAHDSPQQDGSQRLSAQQDSPIDTQAEPVTIIEPELAPQASATDVLSELDWQGLQDRIANSNSCPSCSQHNSLLGVGNAHADWMFVVDAPTQAELQAGHFLVGRAGKLFGGILAALGKERDQVYCSSVFKCAPTEDLSTSPQCDGLLLRQIQLVQPKVVIAFGEFVAQKVIKANEPLPQLRESSRKCYQTNVPIVATYSPAQMLDQPQLKAMVWQDLKRAIAILQQG